MCARSKVENVSLTQGDGAMTDVTVHYEGPEISRETAKELGLTRYFRPKPCRNSHVSERLVSTGKCITCAEDNHAKWRATSRTANPDRLDTEREKTRARQVAWAERNPDK